MPPQPYETDSYSEPNPYCNLGLLYHQTKRVGLAENAFQRADGFLAPRMGDGPLDFIVATSRAAVAHNWGDLHLTSGQTDEALASFDRGIGWCEDILRKEPTYAPARQRLLELHGSKANTYDALKRFAEAAKEWQRAIELAEGAPRLEYRMRRSVSLARGGDSIHAAAEADALAAEPGCSSDLLYNSACVLALSGRADKAMALLSKLQTEGYFENEQPFKELRTDTDLDSLRRRDDFLCLLEKATAKRSPPQLKK